MVESQRRREALLTTIMNLFSEEFRERAIVHGGMVLRLLECPRLTNDIDYIFAPYKSKNQVKDEIIKTLRKIPGISLRHAMNSKCLRITITREETIVQVEVKVESSCKTDVLTSAPLARIHNQTARVISVLKLNVALANKMSAWLDRRLIRDLYDIYFFLNMGVKPDIEALKKRLKKPAYTRGVKPFPGKSPITIEGFLEFLKNETIKLSDDEISNTLADMLSEVERTGLSNRIKATITSKLI